MICLQCKHWNLRDSPLRDVGFGLCKANPNAVTRAGQTFAGNTPCRIGKFERATDQQISLRAKEGSVIL